MEGNRAFGNGGGIYFLGRDANTLIILNTVIQDNMAESNGSGVWAQATSNGAMTVAVVETALLRNKFNNGTPVGGLGLFAGDNSSLTVLNSRFEDNVSGGGSAGGLNVALGNNSTLSVAGSTFLRNHGVHGGGMNDQRRHSSTVTITDSIFDGNVEEGNGSGGLLQST